MISIKMRWTCIIVAVLLLSALETKAQVPEVSFEIPKGCIFGLLGPFFFILTGITYLVKRVQGKPVWNGIPKDNKRLEI